jgi:CheY-like chemotaxis protein
MDVQMPEMDGPTAASTIRAREAQAGRRRTPIVALTANVMSDQIATYMAAGMDGFVAKPVQVAQLFEAIRTHAAQGEPDEDDARPTRSAASPVS